MAGLLGNLNTALSSGLQAAQARLGEEIADFQSEAARTEEWKEEERRRTTLQQQQGPAAPAAAAAHSTVGTPTQASAAAYVAASTPVASGAHRAAAYETPLPEPTPATAHAPAGGQNSAALARRVKELEDALREQKGRAVRDSLAQGEQHAKQLEQLREQHRHQLADAKAAAAADAADKAAAEKASEAETADSETGTQRWQQRLDSLVQVVEADAGAEGADAPPPSMCGKPLLVQLQGLRKDVLAALQAARVAPPPPRAALASAASFPQPPGGEAKGEGPPAAAAAAAPAPEAGEARRQIAALEEQVESLATALAKAELNGRQRAESARRHAEGLQERAEAAEAEVLERMRLVAEAMGEADEAQKGMGRLEEELRDVRSKAGARIKQLVAKDKELEEEVGRLKMEGEMNESKLASMQAALDVMQSEQRDDAKAVKELAAQHAQDQAYVRALVLRYLELEEQHEALFPAIATYFKFTQQEVEVITKGQQAYAHQTSVWGRTLSAGSFLLGVASEAAKEIGGSSGAGTAGAAATGVAGGAAPAPAKVPAPYKPPRR